MNPRTTFSTLFSLVLLGLSSPASAAQPGSTFRFDFDNDNPTRAWTGTTGQLAPGHDGGHSLQITNPDPNGSAVCSIPIPPDQIDGQMVSISATVRASDVSQPPQHWNGIKVMLVLQMGDATDHPQLRIGSGSFPWTDVREVIRLPKGITKARLVLGLEKSSGTAWFDNVCVRAGRPQRTGKPSDRSFKGHDLPRLRGVMIGPEYEAEDIRHLVEEWKANHVRWQLNWTPMKRAEEWARDLDEYDKWLDGALDHMDKALDHFDRTGVKVLVDLHCPPGGRAEGGVCRMFQQEKYRAHLLTSWTRIAKRIRGHKCVYACDLINEPVEPKWGAEITWPELATQAIDTIRAIIPDMPIVLEPGPWGSCAGFDQLVPVDRERVIYSFHMYQPHAFTHQTLHDDNSFTYPGIIKGVEWNKDQLEHAMARPSSSNRPTTCTCTSANSAPSAGPPTTAPSATYATASTCSKPTAGTGPTTPTANSTAGASSTTATGRTHLRPRPSPGVRNSCATGSRRATGHHSPGRPSQLATPLGRRMPGRYAATFFS